TDTRRPGRGRGRRRGPPVPGRLERSLSRRAGTVGAAPGFDPGSGYVSVHVPLDDGVVVSTRLADSRERLLDRLVAAVEVEDAAHGRVLAEHCLEHRRDI